MNFPMLYRHTFFDMKLIFYSIFFVFLNLSYKKACERVLFLKIIETTFTLNTYTEPVDRILVDLIPSFNS